MILQMDELNFSLYLLRSFQSFNKHVWCHYWRPKVSNLENTEIICIKSFICPTLLTGSFSESTWNHSKRSFRYFQGNLVQENVRSGKWPSGKCPLGNCPSRNVLWRITLQGNLLEMTRPFWRLFLKIYDPLKHTRSIAGRSYIMWWIIG